MCLLERPLQAVLYGHDIWSIYIVGLTRRVQKLLNCLVNHGSINGRIWNLGSVNVSMSVNPCWDADGIHGSDILSISLYFHDCEDGLTPIGLNCPSLCLIAALDAVGRVVVGFA